MAGRSSFLPAVIVVAVLLVVVGVFLRPVFQEELHPREYNDYERLQEAADLSVGQIKVVWIRIGRDMYTQHVELHPKTDAEDIVRLQRAIRGIRLVDARVRIPGRKDFVRIEALPSGGYPLYGYFDPANAPVISPGLRSDDFSRVVQDIVKRKGETVYYTEDER